MTTQRSFPRTAVLVLIIGLAAISAIFLLSFAPIIIPVWTNNSLDQAKGLADKYVTGVSSDLSVREVEEWSLNFYVRVQEKSTGINAFELLVDRYSSRVSLEPGPSMMWNTKYGMMGQGGMMGYPRDSTAAMPVTPQQAPVYAQRWLDSNLPGTEVEEPETFYGYYTMDFAKNGTTYGMLSVNGYTGDVWYHTWHGTFIAMAEYG
jgi:hypothetical protein